MSQWRECSLGDVIELKRGYDLPRHARVPGKVPLVSSSGTSGYVSEAKVDGPGVVTGRYGTIGEVFYLTEPFWPLNTTLYVTDFKGSDPRFVSYFLRLLDFMAYSDKAAVPGLNRNHLHVAPVRVPSDSGEQRAIAAVLAALDDKIELNRRMNETLEASARALFRDWFVDFGPTRAKAEGRPAYLALDLWSLFPDRLRDDGVPNGWQLRAVSEFAELTGGRQLEKTRIFETGEVPVFGGAGIMGFTDQHNAEGYVISVGRVGAYCGQYFAHRGRAWINNNASYIRPLERDLAGWLFQSLKELDMDVIKKGAAQPFVSNGDIAKLKLVWPGETIISAFSALLEPLVRQAEACVTETKVLALTRDALLPKLMSGELRVRDVDALAA